MAFFSNILDSDFFSDNFDFLDSVFVVVFVNFVGIETKNNRADILPDLPSAAPFLREQQTQGRASYVSFITGPSRTADIERVSAIGVHGPLELHIVLIGERP